MNKIFFIFLFIFMLSVQSTAQIQNGFVRSQGTPANPNGNRLSRVRVNIKGLHPEKVTDNNGNFNFNLGGGKTQFSILSVTLDDYRLLTKLSSSYNVGSAPIEIVMQSLTEREQNEKRIRQNVERNISKSYNAKMAKLQKEIETLRNVLSYEQKNKEKLQAQINYLGTQVDVLDNQYQHRHKIIDKMIEEYVDFDFAKADSTTTKIRSYIESGELEKADSILNAMNIRQEMSDIRTLRYDIKSKESRLSNEKEILQNKIVRASAYWESKHNIALQRMQFDSATTYIKHLVEVDTCNAINIYKCAQFLLSQNVLKEAEFYYKRCIQILWQEQKNWPLLASSYDALGFLYSKTQRFRESEEMYNKALEIRKRLAKDNSKDYEVELVWSYVNLGNLYGQTQRPKECEAMYNKAIEIFNRLAKTNPKAYESTAAVLFGNLAYFSIDFSKSEELYKTVIAIYERLSKTNPKAYESDLADTYNNLAILYSKTQRFKESEEMCNKAIEIQERLAKINPKVYEPLLANTYNNLAILYRKKQRFKESEEMCNKAIEIQERLTKINPKVYEPLLANTYNNLAILYRKKQHFKECEDVYNKAIEIFERLAKNNPETYEPVLAVTYKSLALLYHDSLKNPTEAVKCFHLAAEQGNKDAQYYLGKCYEYGDGVEKDLTEAVKWYHKAAEQGYAKAQFNLGFCYGNGDGVEKDLTEAAKWFRKAAEQGKAEAQFNLGICYVYGKGIEKDLTEAAKWFRKAAEQGFANAQCNLATCYVFGDGVEKNLTEAVKWYRKAAEQGNATAQNNLAACYQDGDGVEKNLTEAIKWYRMAAKQGYVHAQMYLARCYKYGEGVEKDLTEAAKWYRKAAEQGDEDAKEELRRLGYSVD